MSKSSSVLSNIWTLMVTCRPGGMAGGLCPGSNVLMPRVSGAPRRCPAPEVTGSGSDSAMVHCTRHCPACRDTETQKSAIKTCSHPHSLAQGHKKYRLDVVINNCSSKKPPFTMHQCSSEVQWGLRGQAAQPSVSH